VWLGERHSWGSSIMRRLESRIVMINSSGTAGVSICSRSFRFFLNNVPARLWFLIANFNLCLKWIYLWLLIIYQSTFIIDMLIFIWYSSLLILSLLIINIWINHYFIIILFIHLLFKLCPTHFIIYFVKVERRTESFCFISTFLWNNW